MEIAAPRYDRYPGTRPFADNAAEQKLFFGRDREVHELLHQILSTNLLVVYGKSGLGKTSLLQAGIFPELRQQDFLPLTIRLNDPERPPLDLFFQVIEDLCRRDNIDYMPGETASLWEFFKTVFFCAEKTCNCRCWSSISSRSFSPCKTSHVVRPLCASWPISPALVCRSTYGLNVEQGLNCPTGDRPPEVKIVLVVREDYYGMLQELIRPIPTILEQRYRLAEFDEQQARAAMERPALIEDEQLFHTPPFRYNSHAVDQMLQFLRGRSGIIEPFQLQILCQYVEQTGA